MFRHTILFGVITVMVTGCSGQGPNTPDKKSKQANKVHQNSLTEIRQIIDKVVAGKPGESSYVTANYIIAFADMSYPDLASDDLKRKNSAAFMLILLYNKVEDSQHLLPSDKERVLREIEKRADWLKNVEENGELQGK